MTHEDPDATRELPVADDDDDVGPARYRSYSPSEVVSFRVRELREKRGLTAKELAERCARAGAPSLNRSVIANLENGLRTRVSIDEVLVLAYVLDVTPLHLFVPIYDYGYVAVTPKLDIKPEQVRAWVRGQQALPGQDAKSYRVQVPDVEWKKREEREDTVRDLAGQVQWLSAMSLLSSARAAVSMMALQAPGRPIGSREILSARLIQQGILDVLDERIQVPASLRKEWEDLEPMLRQELADLNAFLAENRGAANPGEQE